MLNDYSIIMVKADSKKYILQKTFFLLLTKGYDGVSITDIQQETGMSRGLLYHYFKSKEELFRTAGETFLIDVFLTYPTQTDGYGLLEMIGYVVKRYKKVYKEWDISYRSSKVSIANYDFLMYQMIEKDRQMAARYADMRHKEMDTWRNAATTSLQNNLIRTVLNDNQIACHVVALLDGIWMQAVEEWDQKRYLNQIEQILMDYYNLLKI